MIASMAPINLKSDCFKYPVPNAIALGGVEIGRNKAVEADKPIANDTVRISWGNKVMPIGISKLAAAVLLIIFERIVVIKASKIIRYKLLLNVGIILTICLASPESLITIPSVKPPETNIKVSHGNPLKSSAVTNPPAVNSTIGIKETTATGILCKLVVIHNPMVIEKVVTSRIRFLVVFRDCGLICC